MKKDKLLLIFLCFILSCTVTKQRAYTIRATITNVKAGDNGYWVYFRSSYKFYKTWQAKVPDTIYAGKVIDIPIVYRIK